MKIDFIVCEDNLKTRDTICDWLESYVDHEDVQLALSTSQPELVLTSFENDGAIKIYLLDINLNKNINGVALAEKIKSKNANSKIIFITAYAEWAVESLNRNIEPFAYLTKPLDRQTFDWHIKRLLKKIKEFHEFSLQDDKHNLVKLEAYGRAYYKKANNITYIETYHKEGYLVVHTLQGEKIIHRSRLSEMLSQLNGIHPGLFLQCYKSNLVNHHFIEIIDKKQGKILLKNGTKLFMSRSKEIQEEIEKKIMGLGHDEC